MPRMAGYRGMGEDLRGVVRLGVFTGTNALAVIGYVLLAALALGFVAPVLYVLWEIAAAIF